MSAKGNVQDFAEGGIKKAHPLGAPQTVDKLGTTAMMNKDKDNISKLYNNAKKAGDSPLSLPPFTPQKMLSHFHGDPGAYFPLYRNTVTPKVPRHFPGTPANDYAYERKNA